jgi:hypothetical protein
MNESVLANSDVISGSTSLRNLFQIGFNTKSLTKALVSSINISAICNKITKLVEKDELSIKSCAPLILGLTRVYGKKVKVVLEDLNTALDINKKEPSGDSSLIKTSKKAKKRLSTAIKDELEESTLYSTRNNDNILSMSPLNDGLFNQLKDRIAKTPQRLAMDHLETPPMEIFRAGFPSSLQKDTTLNEMKSYDKMEEGENFFKFISENTHSDNKALDMDFDINLADNVQFEASNLPSILKFSETKSLLEEFKNKSFREFNKLKPKVDEEKRMQFGYDKDISLNVKALVKDSTVNINTDKLMDKFKGLLMDKVSDLHVNLPAEDQADERYLNELSTSFLNLDIKEFNIETFNEKLSRILVEESNDEIQEEPEILNDIEEPKFEDNPFEEDQGMVMEQQDLTAEFNTTTLQAKEKLLDNIPKKDINFLSLKDKVEVNPADMFYSLLCMAQSGEISLEQAEMFENESIFIKRIIN